MELYTSLTRLKMSLGGQLPDMTPLAPAAMERLDPTFTPGMGALEENGEGLRCPFVGCGRYFKNLAPHLRAHGSSSGQLKELLDIPQSVGLVAEKERERLSARCRDMAKQYSIDPLVRLKSLKRASRSRGGFSKQRTHRQVGYRNLHDSCDSQLSAKYQALVKKLGRTPTLREATTAWGHPFIGSIRKVYGSWNSFQAQNGWVTRKACKPFAYTITEILTALSQWYTQHGDLPTSKEAVWPIRTPKIPSRFTIQRAFRVGSWVLAMRQAATALGINSHRYDVTEKVA